MDDILESDKNSKKSSNKSIFSTVVIKAYFFYNMSGRKIEVI